MQLDTNRSKPMFEIFEDMDTTLEGISHTLAEQKHALFAISQSLIKITALLEQMSKKQVLKNNKKKNV